MKKALPLFVACCALAQAPHQHAVQTPVFTADPRLAKVHSLLRQSKTEDARAEINRLLKETPHDAELFHQLSRSYLTDFYELREPNQRRTALALAMEALDNTLRREPNHIPALKSKAVIHARAELLYYNPNLAFELAARVAKLQPAASEYLLGLTDWLSGEVRFSAETEHRVPHDPALGLDRSIEILNHVIDSAVPYSNEEAAGFFQLAKSYAKNRQFKESIEYFDRALSRPALAGMRGEILREVGVSHYRLGNYPEAARSFYRALETQVNSIDQWLLKVSIDAWKDAAIKLPDAFAFPTAPPQSAPNLVFENIAPQLGINRFDGNGTVSWGDYDRDGRPDLFLAGSGTFLAVYRNEGERFREVTAEVGLARVPSGYSLNLIDYDNDGRLDLYLALNGWSGPMPNRLYRNVNGKFVDVSKESGAADGGSSFISLWGDFDNDGWIDLAIANGVLKDGSTPQLYRNVKGKFENVTRAAGIIEPPTYGAIGIAVGDYDRDGDLDLFVNGLVNSPNRLYRNDGNFKFTDVTRAAGLAAQPYHNGFVAFFTDYDNDLYPDLLVTSLAPWESVVEGLKSTFAPKSLHPDSTRLYRNNRAGGFVDVTLAAGLGGPMGVMGAGVADVDNDGFIDFYFGTGDPQLSRLEPNRFFHNNGDGTFTDLTSHVGFARPGNKGHGVAFIDLDEDGDLEIYAQLGGHYPGDHAENAFYRNLQGNRNNWLEIDLGYAIGARIDLIAGPLKLTREVKGSEGFGATNPYRQHFGLGRQSAIDSIEIRWPNGRLQQLANVKPNQILKVEGPLPK